MLFLLFASPLGKFIYSIVVFVNLIECNEVKFVRFIVLGTFPILIEYSCSSLNRDIVILRVSTSSCFSMFISVRDSQLFILIWLNPLKFSWVNSLLFPIVIDALGNLFGSFFIVIVLDDNDPLLGNIILSFQELIWMSLNIPEIWTSSSLDKSSATIDAPCCIFVAYSFLKGTLLKLRFIAVFDILISSKFWYVGLLIDELNEMLPL